MSKPDRSRSQFVAAALEALLLLVCVMTFSAAEGAALDEEPAVWRLEIDNDFFVRDDEQLSAGWSLQRHSAAAADWGRVRAPRWLSRVGDCIPSLHPEDHVKRLGIGIGQLIQTPTDLSRSDPNEADVPYVAALGGFVSWTAVNPEHMTGFQIFIGATGEPALGEEAQSWGHELIDDQDPKGWDQQIGFEPLLNIDYNQWWKLADTSNAAAADGFGADVSVGGFAALGNLNTSLEASVQTRIGWNLPLGFSTIPNPGGNGIAQLPRVGSPERTAVYLTAAGRARALAYTLFLDGSLFDDDEPEAPPRDSVVFEGVFGLHLVHRHFALRSHYIFSTDPVGLLDSSRSMGSITLEWSL